MCYVFIFQAMDLNFLDIYKLVLDSRVYMWIYDQTFARVIKSPNQTASGAV
jgi:hypothetical protein